MALARALAVEPAVLLLDEPFGALDAKVRKELRDWLRRLHDEVHVTTVFVTHDQEEALEVADEIVVINEGRVEQIGSPDQLYDEPANDFVMRFLGPVTQLGAVADPPPRRPRRHRRPGGRRHPRPDRPAHPGGLRGPGRRRHGRPGRARHHDPHRGRRPPPRGGRHRVALPRSRRAHRAGRQRAAAGQRRRPAAHRLTRRTRGSGSSDSRSVPMTRRAIRRHGASATAGRSPRCPSPPPTLRTCSGARGSASPRRAWPRSPPLADRDAAIARVTDVSLAPPATGAPLDGGWVEGQWEAWYQLCWWWMERMRTSPVPLVEKMVLFWHNHFVSGQEKLYDMGLLYTQNQLFRQHALGDYHALVQGMAIDPAMLWYLDNAENVAGREQENFAREVMELFTMGQGNYTEADVISMARAWTGHNVIHRRSLATCSGRPRHDNGTKVLFGGPATNWNGPATLTEILRGSRAVPASRFITAKLFSYLAYPIAVTDPLVASLADGFRAADLSILSLVRADPPLRRLLEPRREVRLGAEPHRVVRRRAWRPSASRRRRSTPSGGWRARASSSSTRRTWRGGSRTPTGSARPRDGPAPRWASYVRWKANDAGVFAGIQSPARRDHRHAGVPALRHRRPLPHHPRRPRGVGHPRQGRGRLLVDPAEPRPPDAPDPRLPAGLRR